MKNQEKVYHIDNVTVEARKRINIHEAKRTPLNFIGEQELQERGGLSLRSILSRFPSITVRETTEGGGIGELGALQQIERFSRMTDRTGDLSTTSNGELGIYWKSSIGQKTP